MSTRMTPAGKFVLVALVGVIGLLLVDVGLWMMPLWEPFEFILTGATFIGAAGIGWKLTKSSRQAVQIADLEKRVLNLEGIILRASRPRQR